MSGEREPRMVSTVRRRTMQAVRSKNTTPERAVRRALRAMGIGYRLHRDDLPGKPDLVLSKHQTCIFVQGCFWHGHDCKRGQRLPKTNAEYWRAKISRNMQRDAANAAALSKLGWRVLWIWECDLRAQGPEILLKIGLFPRSPVDIACPAG